MRIAHAPANEINRSANLRAAVLLQPVITHRVKVCPSKSLLAKTDQLAWKLAAVGSDSARLLPEVAEMIVNRIIDNAAVAIAAINREPVAHARSQALAHPRASGATLFGSPSADRFECEW